jgi:hypothetical protein
MFFGEYSVSLHCTVSIADYEQKWNEESELIQVTAVLSIV